MLGGEFDSVGGQGGGGDEQMGGDELGGAFVFVLEPGAGFAGVEAVGVVGDDVADFVGDGHALPGPGQAGVDADVDFARAHHREAEGARRERVVAHGEAVEQAA